MSTDEFTAVLARFREGDAAAEQQLITVIYGELRRLARRQLKGNRWMATLNTTALVHESYLRLVAPAAQHTQTQAHFLNLASRVMRQIVIDYARKRLRELVHVDKHATVNVSGEKDDAELAQARQFIALDEALSDLAKRNPRQAQVVTCRFFAGLSEDETAEALGTSARTVQRDWNDARTWLEQHMR
ncbi:MAG: sigma-70 family RNA polymerase sigma factor [Rhodanobacteraceae bacterium]|nr:sigma-70 family RNA polymerase sigma factor [Rhodanobacteraceae bacterium]